MSMKEFFLQQIPKNKTWPVYPDAIQGFSEDELQRYCDALNIEAHGELREFLLTFGRCSGGMFLADPFFYYGGKDPFTCLDKVADWHRDFIQYHVEQGYFTDEDVQKKPYYLFAEEEAITVFVYTTDPALNVWQIYDNAGIKSLYEFRLDFLAKQVKALKEDAPDLFPDEQIANVARSSASTSALSMLKAVLLEEKYLSEFYRNLHLKTREDILKISTCHFM